ncbi:MAG: hypothetical protein KC620_21785, partial [Myxococcales bacterium]|nr:hypothetical protein [Myxococcales bacterium]
SDVCGCGPRLMYCTENSKQYTRVRRAVQREVDDTIAYVVNQDMPLDELFSMNGTVRNRDAEFVYRRARVAAGEDESVLDLKDFGKKAKLTPRTEQVPGQQAGILTAPSLIYSSDALRGVMRNYYTYLWCAEPARSRVTTEAVLGLDVVDLRVGDGWKQLAAMPICTDCHARLDYGMQFFHGYPSSVNGIDFRPSDSLKGPGKFYGDNIDDFRGEQELNPSGFAKMALAQSEFAECMSRRVLDHVFGGSVDGKDFDAVLATFEKTRKLKPTMRTALQHFARRVLAGEALPKPVAAAAAPPAAGEPSDKVTISDALRRDLDNHCMECHDEGDAFDFNGMAFDRERVETMAELVAFEVMPKTPRGLDDAVRRRMTEELVDLLWTKPETRAQAMAFYCDGMRAYPAHRFFSAMGAVKALAGGEKGVSVSVVESSVRQSLQRYSPGFATATALNGLASCKAAGKTGEALVECIRRSTDPAAVIAGTVGP